MRKLVLGVALLVSCAVGYAGPLQSLNKNQVMKVLGNKTITTIPLNTLQGQLIANNKVSVFFAKDGQLIGRFESKPDNNPQSDEGTWKVNANGQTCVSWKTWTENKPVCVYAYKLANSLLFVNTANKFESMVLTDNIADGNQVGA